MNLLRVLVAIANAPLPEDAKDDLERRCADARLTIEKWLAIGLVLFALSSIWNAAAAARAAGPESADSEMASRLQALQAHPPTDRLWVVGVLLGFAGLGLVLFPALPILIWQARKRLLAGTLPDFARRPPRWGILIFVAVAFGWKVIGAGLASTVTPAKVVVEEPAPQQVELRPGAAALFGPKTAQHDAGAVVPVEHATSVRAKVELRNGKILLIPEPGVASAPQVFVDAAPVTSTIRLHDGQRIKIDEVVARIDDPTPLLDAKRMMSIQVLGTALAVFFLIVVVVARGGSPRDLGLGLDGAPLEIARGIGIVLIALPWVYLFSLVNTLVLKALDIPAQSHPLTEEMVTHADGPAIVAIFIAACVGAPIFEELLFRGVLYRALRRPLASAGALVVVGLVFGSLHPLATVLPVGFLGALLAAIFTTSKRGSLLGSIAGHATFNATSLAMALLVRKLIYG